MKSKSVFGDPDENMLVLWALNATLEKILDLERVLIRSGLNLPFGGSLLLIGQKI